MKKISALAALAMAALVLATPAHADEGDADRGRISVAGYPVTTAHLCREALSLLPVATPWTSIAVDDACANRDHAYIHDTRNGPTRTAGAAGAAGAPS